jgi:putative aldouronate transport system permease protein
MSGKFAPETGWGVQISLKARKAAAKPRYKADTWGRDFRTNYELYLFILPAVLVVFLFNYLPIYGIQIAFKNFAPTLGIWGSPWAGLKWFARFFSSYQCLDVIGNTVLLSVYQLVFSFPIPIIFALIVNQYKNQRWKKTLQTVAYAPHFISTVVIAGMITLFLSPSVGMYGNLMRLMGLTPTNIMGESGLFRTIYISTDVWQHMGWESIIYIAALSTADMELYDAAKVDGANRFHRIRHIELPALQGTMVILLILRVGSIMSVGFEKVYLLQNSLNLATSEIIATYVYKIGLQGTPQYSYSAAIGLLNSVVNLLLLVGFNAFSRRISEKSLW